MYLHVVTWWNGRKVFDIKSCYKISLVFGKLLVHLLSEQYKSLVEQMQLVENFYLTNLLKYFVNLLLNKNELPKKHLI